jgi:hypothetical protein
MSDRLDHSFVAIYSFDAHCGLRRSQNPPTKVLVENPIQNAVPKNWLGWRCVSGLVVKKIPITGRFTAILIANVSEAT